MKHEKTFKTFSALSFDGKAVTGVSEPVPGDSQPRLTPESVRDFNVHQDGAADEAVPQAEDPGAARRWRGTERGAADHGGAARPEAQEAGPTAAAADADAFRATLLRRSRAPYEVAAPYRHWGINE
jgi:hypothetical protein